MWGGLKPRSCWAKDNRVHSHVTFFAGEERVEGGCGLQLRPAGEMAARFPDVPASPQANSSAPMVIGPLQNGPSLPTFPGQWATAGCPVSKESRGTLASTTTNEILVRAVLAKEKPCNNVMKNGSSIAQSVSIFNGF